MSCCGERGFHSGVFPRSSDKHTGRSHSGAHFFLPRRSVEIARTKSRTVCAVRNPSLKPLLVLRRKYGRLCFLVWLFHRQPARYLERHYLFSSIRTTLEKSVSICSAAVVIADRF